MHHAVGRISRLSFPVHLYIKHDVYCALRTLLRCWTTDERSTWSRAEDRLPRRPRTDLRGTIQDLRLQRRRAHSPGRCELPENTPGFFSGPFYERVWKKRNAGEQTRVHGPMPSRPRLPPLVPAPPSTWRKLRLYGPLPPL